MADFFKILEAPLTKPPRSSRTKQLSRTIRDQIELDLAALSLRRDAISRTELPGTFRDRDAAAREFGLARDGFIHSLYRTKLTTRKLAAKGGSGSGAGGKKQQQQQQQHKTEALSDLKRELALLEAAQDEHRALEARLSRARVKYAAAEEELARTLAEREALSREIALCTCMLKEVERYGLSRVVDGGLGLDVGGGRVSDGRVREGLVGYVDSVLGGEAVHAVGWL
ncbi:hypothetical protein MGG_03025 [Pyricularia oryzae 70-15]|uniref:Uncharacterized protein n=2 Tax=Pyricularia oryzae TaxID=318829 RepID=G4NKU3_PYRO7|nr:uncharacterized protein MGG_03025 [Pyricularia oryzae 70-15]EHA45921.1 hypothetical protein MGG_03025 [Pyricularia oryzae 70-15]KAI7910030.1 hypothetical protein M0657_011559 [Pyricularia oryzae]KAI7918019.1 hypothetical protein M9X92_007089 [Pyricularia oryzae]